jgi:hypothetical protein
MTRNPSQPSSLIACAREPCSASQVFWLPQMPRPDYTITGKLVFSPMPPQSLSFFTIRNLEQLQSLVIHYDILYISPHSSLHIAFLLLNSGAAFEFRRWLLVWNIQAVSANLLWLSLRCVDLWLYIFLWQLIKIGSRGFGWR